MSSLPSYVKVLLAGFGEARESGVQRTAMESGPPKQLKVKSRVLVTRDCTLRVASKAEYLTFVTWFETTIDMGADWFDWADPVSGTTKSARIVSLGEAAPDATLAGAWRIPASIETWSA